MEAASGTVVIVRSGDDPTEAVVFGRSEELDLLGAPSDDIPRPFVAAMRAAVASAPQLQMAVDQMTGRVLRLTEEGARLLRRNESMRAGLITGVVRNPENGRIAGQLTFVDPAGIAGLASSLPSLAGGVAMQMQLAQIERALDDIKRDLGYLIRGEHLKIEAGIETNLEILQSVHAHTLRYGEVEDDQWDRLAGIERTIRALHKETKKHLRTFEDALDSHGDRLAVRVARLGRALIDERTLFWLRAHVHAELALARWDALYLLRQADRHPDDLDDLVTQMQAAMVERHQALHGLSRRITHYLVAGDRVTSLIDQLRIVRKRKLRALLAELDDLLQVFPPALQAPPAEDATSVPAPEIDDERRQWQRLVTAARALPAAAHPLREFVVHQAERVPIRRGRTAAEDMSEPGVEEEVVVVVNDWDQYESRYSERPETYRAYVDVWLHNPEAPATFSGWASFSQAANAEPKQVSDHADRVAEAERIMRASGYEIGGSTRRGARRWFRADRPSAPPRQATPSVLDVLGEDEAD